MAAARPRSRLDSCHDPRPECKDPWSRLDQGLAGLINNLLATPMPPTHKNLYFYVFYCAFGPRDPSHVVWNRFSCRITASLLQNHGSGTISCNICKNMVVTYPPIPLKPSPLYPKSDPKIIPNLLQNYCPEGACKNRAKNKSFTKGLACKNRANFF